MFGNLLRIVVKKHLLCGLCMIHVKLIAVDGTGP